MSAIHDPAILDDFRRAHAVGALVQPRVGLVGAVRHLPLRLGEAEIEVVGASLSDVARVFRRVAAGDVLGGAGSDLDLERAWLRAVVEAAERYASLTYSEADFVRASARELGDAALDLGTLPRCSALEYADPRCPLRPPDPERPIRWVRGHSLVDGTERLVPAVMVHLALEPWDSERFWLQISTGVAAHTSPQPALAAAICEAIERDALALAWLGRLRLPRLPPPESPEPEVETLLARAAGADVAFHHFDATTDLAVPTVLSVQLCDGHPHCAVSMSCATATDPQVALRKVLCEATSGRVALDEPHRIPRDVADFTHMTHGAHYHGRGGHREDLAFLLDDDGGRLPPIAVPPPLEPASDAARLELLVERLRAKQMDAVAVDLTTDELRDVGLWAVRVVVPQLMPVSFVHRARFLGTPRLRDFVARRTGAPWAEDRVNPSPIPFA